MQRLRGRDERASLHPQQPHADKNNERIAQNLDRIDGAGHRGGGGIEQRRRNAHDQHCDERLHQRRGKRQHDPAPPGLLVGDEIGRDHRLAVTRAGGMEDAVEKRQPQQAPGRAAVRLGRADQARRTAGRIPPAWRKSSRARRLTGRPALAAATCRTGCPGRALGQCPPAPGSSAPRKSRCQRPRSKQSLPDRQRSRTFHHDLVGEFGADGQRRISLVGAERCSAAPRGRHSFVPG